jgi:cyanophycin synthetase
VAIARLELGDLTGRETTDFPGFAERLVMALPGLHDHHCAAGQPGGFTDSLARGTYFGHVLEHVTLELSALAGREVHLGRTLWAGADGRYDVVTECPGDEPEDSAVPGELFDLARTVVADLIHKRRPETAVPLEAIGRSVERERLGPSTAAIAEAARRRDIPVRRIGTTSMLRLGYGRYRRMVSAALTGGTSALGTDIACDKVLAKQLLGRAGIPVPAGVVACGAAEAAAALATFGPPVVVKPRNGSHGSYVTVGVRTASEMERAYRHAAAGAGSCAVIVEEYAPGHDYRVLVVGGRVAAAAQLRPPQVTGDGIATIGELIEEVNADPRRGDGHCRVLTKISIDDTMLAHLAVTGLDLHCVPAEGQVVTLRRNGNLSTGGTSKDVTDLVHPDIAELCRRAADVAGLDVCGVDLRAEDIAAPLFGGLRHQAAAVIEINACPGLRMHLAPDEGTPRDVADAIVCQLYPPGAASRVPVVAVTGSNGKTTTVRMIEHILRRSGLRTGLSSTDGVFIGGQCVQEADASGPRSAQIVLDDPAVEAAVLETARGGIVRRGLGYDRADVAVITNISTDHLGDDNIDDLDELIDVKSLVAEEISDGGSLVLNADDPATTAIAERHRVRKRKPVIRFFSVRDDRAPAASAASADGLWYQVIDGQLTETADGRALPVLDVAELPGAFGGRARHVVANALAAIAACRALGISGHDIAAALRVFTPCEANPGRGNVYAVAAGPDATTPAGPVLLDYGHNAAALAATGQMVAEVWPGAATAALTLPGDRRDDLIAESAQAIADRFAIVVIYEDQDLRGRRPGEMRGLIESALRQARPDIRVAHAEGPDEALRSAVSLATGGPVLFVYEKLAAARAALEALSATPWPEEDLLGKLVSGQVLDDIAREFAHEAAETMPLPEPPGQRELST